jgi:Domain of unknown function (DUF4355)
MADETTTNAQPTPDEPGKKDGGAAGAATPAAATTEAPKTFTQDEVNTIVQSRLAERERKLKAKYEAEIAAKVEATRNEALADLDKQVEERVTARAAELQLAATRAEIQKTRGLTDKQAARLVGTTPEELLADAVEVFGTLPTDEEAEPDDAADADKPAKKRAPKIAAARGGQGGGLDISKMSPAEIRKHAKDLWPKR